MRIANAMRAYWRRYRGPGTGVYRVGSCGHWMRLRGNGRLYVEGLQKVRGGPDEAVLLALSGQQCPVCMQILTWWRSPLSQEPPQGLHPWLVHKRRAMADVAELLRRTAVGRAYYMAFILPGVQEYGDHDHV
jgi:hypothetical protein